MLRKLLKDELGEACVGCKGKGHFVSRMLELRSRKEGGSRSNRHGQARALTAVIKAAHACCATTGAGLGLGAEAFHVGAQSPLGLLFFFSRSRSEELSRTFF